MGLTKRKIEQLQTKGRYRDEKNLYLNVSETGSKSWVLRITVNGKRKDLGLGPFPEIDLTMAREKTFEARRKVAQGKPLFQTKKPSIPTFKELAEQEITQRVPTWKNGERRARAWRSIFEQYVYPEIGNMAVSDISSGDLLRIVSPLWGTKHHQALKIRQWVGAVLESAIAYQFRSDNPNRILNRALPKATNLQKHYKAVHHSEVGDVVRTIHKSRAYKSTILCFEFTVLCAVRPSEARLAQWSEIDLKNRLWTIPLERMKAGREHRVPLSSRCVDILKELEAYKERNLDLVFPSARGKQLSDSTVSKLCRENGVEGVLHGISRSCFRSWCADTGVSREVAESCLAHVLGKTEGSYQRSDLFKRRANVMQKWADYISGKQESKVLSFPSVR